MINEIYYRHRQVYGYLYKGGQGDKQLIYVLGKKIFYLPYMLSGTMLYDFKKISESEYYDSIALTNKTLYTGINCTKKIFYDDKPEIDEKEKEKIRTDYRRVFLNE